MDHITKHQVNPMSDNYYGQFVTFNDSNEIRCYSRNGKPIYYAENPPVSPDKNKLSNVIDSTPYKSYSTFGILYGILASCVFLVIFISLYVLFFE